MTGLSHKGFQIPCEKFDIKKGTKGLSPLSIIGPIKESYHN
jgi:hypothetical protein